LKIVGIETGVEIVYSADLPLKTAGFGLASSSAIAVGVLNALYAFQGVYATPNVLAKRACEIEIERLNQRIGIQDQYAVAHGGFNVYHFNGNDTVDISPVVCGQEKKAALECNLMLFYTGVMRNSSEILKEQDENIGDKMEMLDGLVETVKQAHGCLVSGDINDWGRLLDEAWKTKKRFAAGVSTPLIDEMYNKAMAAGALGGKILGAGGGGFLMMYVPKGRHAAVREALKDYRELPMIFAGQGSRIIFAD
jgi:D-glycero-alpha-D-manno-heptose-7-phosphate kinase